jgi:DNA-binding NarL/FixJ family response regulator
MERHTGTSWKDLSPRQVAIMEMVCQGAGNFEIADKLGCKARTVKAHMNRTFIRFGITNGIKRVKLATRLYREDLRQQTRESEEAKNRRRDAEGAD